MAFEQNVLPHSAIAVFQLFVLNNDDPKRDEVNNCYSLQIPSNNFALTSRSTSLKTYIRFPDYL